MPYLGESTALLSALSFGLCSLFFAMAGRSIGALAVNQIRIYVGVAVLFAVHRVLLGSLWPEGLPETVRDDLLWSGVIGLALGDLALFHCFKVLGPRIGTLLMSLWPLMASGIAVVWLGESLGAAEWTGIVITVTGVALVLGSDRSSGTAWQSGLSSAARSFALLAGVLGALGQALGAVLAKRADGAVEGLDSLSATLVRMAAGAAAILVIALVSGHLPKVLHATRNAPALRQTLSGAFFGPILGVWLQMVALQNASTGTAAALLATTPIFMIPIARIAYGARPAPLAVFGTIAAVAGCGLLLTAG